MPKITCVCVVCLTAAGPSQWFGMTEAGKIIYIRYKHGRLFVYHGEALKHFAAYEMIFKRDVGGKGSSHLSYEDMKTATADILALPVDAL